MNSNQRNHNLSAPRKKDIFAMIFYLSIPLLFIITNFISQYKIFSYILIIFLIIVYSLFLQFFMDKNRKNSLSRNLYVLTIINIIVTSFLIPNGGLSSNFSFLTYLIIFLTVIFYSKFITILEISLLMLIFFFDTLYNVGLRELFVVESNKPYLYNFLGFIISFPLFVTAANYIDVLKEKSKSLLISKDLLKLQDVEDETLFSEINKGIIILDRNLRIIKLSRWIAVNLEITPELYIGKDFSQLKFHDYITNRKLNRDDYFFNNLEDNDPKKIKWRVVFKNQYGKFQKLIVKQIPLKMNEFVSGFMIIINYPQRSLDKVLSSFEQILAFRLNSSLGMVKNLLENKGVKDEKIDRHLQSLSSMLKDMKRRNEILKGEYEISVEKFDILNILSNISEEMKEIANIRIWEVDPYLKNRGLSIKSDLKTFKRIIFYVLEATVLLSKNKAISMSINLDSSGSHPRLILTTKAKEGLPKNAQLGEEFFGGKLVLLSKYKGSGMELSNAKLLANYLNFDFNAKISNNKVIVEIIFKQSSHEETQTK